MANQKKSINKLLFSLQERAKELNCYYAVQSILSCPDLSLDETCQRLLEVIPPGWQYPDICRIKISFGNTVHSSPDFSETPWCISADVIVAERVFGSVSVYYAEEAPSEVGGVFLDEEKRLLQTIADHLSQYLENKHMSSREQVLKSSTTFPPVKSRADWQVALATIKTASNELYLRVSRKMLNYLCWIGNADAKNILSCLSTSRTAIDEKTYPGDTNRPQLWYLNDFSGEIAAQVFDIAATQLDCQKILELVQQWVQEDKQSFILELVDRNIPISRVADIIRRYCNMLQDRSFVRFTRIRGIIISLIRRFLSEQNSYICIAKDLIDITDIHRLLENVIYTAGSQGQLGGKGAGLYLASKILSAKGTEPNLLQAVRTPKTWYITSDVLLHFVRYCGFDELIEHKYKPVEQVRLEYPCIVQAFKSVEFPPDIVKGLSVALDDLGTNPLIIRSSSLLEDRIGAAFSGKYKSLFLANQGSKRQRMEALTDAIAEVYASTFGPDPIEYRIDRGLLDYNEEMGILIQQVVGKQVGRYFLPAYAGVAFSHNEFCWSPRIKHADGLLRMTPGLGTRAVDRLSDDYPVLVSPGRPNLRVNVTAEEIERYSPQKVDVINLYTNSFESIELQAFLAEVGSSFPELSNIFSVNRAGHICEIPVYGIDFTEEQPIVTFNRLLSRTPFIKQMRSMMQTLQDTLGHPVDIEFASDGEHLYLLQCRPQSYSLQTAPEEIPRDVPGDRVIFTAHRYVTNGTATRICHIVYVVPEAYGCLPTRDHMLEVGRAVHKLNKLLPKRQFVLMGPGRWGSRGDIKLGVSVDYSDINNTAMLIEIARRKGDYVPELSFGTHFFQDLVEAEIRYLPLYPDDACTIFNETFLRETVNALPTLLPEYAWLSDTIRVIDLRQLPEPMFLSVVMNAEKEEALGFLTKVTAE